ncbi:ATP-binding cassette domain-containing protein [Paenibacillus rhizoplanae]
MNLNVERLSVSFGEAKIVQEVSLRVQNKQFVGLIGPNGCGKSTLLKKHLQGHQAPSGRGLPL